MGDQRQTLSISLIEDMPRAFTHLFKNYTCFGGPYAEILRYFAQYNNFQLHWHIFNEEPSLAKIYFDINQGRFNMSTYSTAFVERKAKGSQSYPVEYMEKCIMVPLEPEIPKYLYIIWPYGRYIWLTIFVGSIYIGILMRFVAIASGNQNSSRSIIRNISHALNISLYTNNMGINIKNAPFMVLVFYFLLYIYGFMLAAYHAPYMTAYNMKPIFVPPLDTVKDILESKLRLKIKNSDYQELQSNDDIDLTNFQHIIDNITDREFQQLIRDFNRSFAYVVSLDQWNFIEKQQQILKQPYFHLSEVCFSAALRVFPIQSNWMHATTLNTFLLRSQQAGLWQLWIDLAFQRALFTKNATILRDTYPVEPLNVEFFTIAWSIIIGGLMLSFLIMGLEYIIWFYQSQKYKVIVV